MIGKNRGKLLRWMRVVLVGTFLVVLAATTTYVSQVSHLGWVGALRISAPVWGITGFLCIAWYLVYKWYLGKRL